MEDEVFKKYFERIEEIYFTFQGNGFFEEDMRKQKVKQILEEIWQDGYEHGEPMKWTIHYPKNMRR